MPFTVRDAVTDDAGAIARLLRVFDDDPNVLPLDEDEVRGRLAGFVVAVEGGRVFGCAALRPLAPGCAEVASVCVSGESRGRGVGGALVSRLEERARGQGVGELFLVTALPSFFGRLGYASCSPFGLPASALAAKALDAVGQPLRRWPKMALTRYSYMRKWVGGPAGALIVAAWPQTLVRVTGSWFDLPLALLGMRIRGDFYRIGHAAVVVVEAPEGRARYFDCGRYDCPPQMGRVRGDGHDPELALPVRGTFAADGSLTNAEELLRALAGLKSSHGEGFMVGAVRALPDPRAAVSQARALQGCIHPFRHFAPASLNCTRFILRLTRFVPRAPLLRALELMGFLMGPSPAFLVRAAAGPRGVAVIDESGLAWKGRWGVFMRGRAPVVPSPGHERGEGSALPPPRPAEVPAGARWLSGTAFGKWVHLEASARPGAYRLRRYSPEGVLEFDLPFEPDGGPVFDFSLPFELGYPTHGGLCTIVQRGAECRLVPAEDGGA